MWFPWKELIETYWVKIDRPVKYSAIGPFWDIKSCEITTQTLKKQSVFWIVMWKFSQSFRKQIKKLEETVFHCAQQQFSGKINFLSWVHSIWFSFFFRFACWFCEVDFFHLKTLFISKTSWDTKQKRFLREFGCGKGKRVCRSSEDKVAKRYVKNEMYWTAKHKEEKSEVGSDSYCTQSFSLNFGIIFFIIQLNVLFVLLSTLY